MFEFAVFWIFAAILVIAAGCVITVRNPVHSALFLVLAFFTAAALWMLLRAEFLAIALVLVYVGAVMVLFLFVVMMLDINLERLREGFWSYLPLGAAVGLVMVFEMVLVLGGAFFQNPSRSRSMLMSSIITTKRKSTITAPTYTSTSTMARNSA